MKRFNVLFVALCLFQGISAKNEEVLTDALRSEFRKHLGMHNQGYAYAGNWKRIFKIIDENHINPSVFRFSLAPSFEGEGFSKPLSLLEFALDILRLDHDTFDVEIREKNAFDAIKTLLEKYHIFKYKLCGGDNCDHLVELALESDRWEISEGREHLEVVDLLLKHGAKVNAKTRKNIKEIYDGEADKGRYPHVKAFLYKK